MNWRALALFPVWVSGALAGDWRATLTPPQPGTFPPPRPLKAHYTFGWSAFTAAEVQTDFATIKGGLLELKVKGATTGAVRALWPMSADHTSVIHARTLRPVSLVQNETYSDESRKTSVAFDSEGAARTRHTKPKDKDSGKTKRFKFAPLFDLHSALLFIRSQPLKPGDTVRLVCYPAAQAYYAEIEVLGREAITAAGKKYDALKLALRLQRVNKQLELESHKKFKQAWAWLSDDTDRLLLKIEAEIMVGKVWMDLEHVEFAK
jgi:Protein of unknown function (DUF3108)